jgi:hypothetical protein
MRSAEELRVEARRLRESVNTVRDPVRKRELAAAALELAERAEALARLPPDPEKLRISIERYRRLLAARADDDDQQRIITELLQDAEELLGRLTGGC